MSISIHSAWMSRQIRAWARAISVHLFSSSDSVFSLYSMLSPSFSACVLHPRFPSPSSPSRLLPPLCRPYVYTHTLTLSHTHTDTHTRTGTHACTRTHGLHVPLCGVTACVTLASLSLLLLHPSSSASSSERGQVAKGGKEWGFKLWRERERDYGRTRTRAGGGGGVRDREGKKGKSERSRNKLIRYTKKL